MKRMIGLMIALALAAALLPGAALATHPSEGNFGLSEFDFTYTNADGTSATNGGAGSHPFAMTASIASNLDGKGLPEGWLKDVFVKAISGLLADPIAYPRCSNADFLFVDPTAGTSACPLNTQVGVNAVSSSTSGGWTTAPVYNLTPPPGVLLRFGFSIGPANITVDGALSQEPPYNPIATSRNVSQLVEVVGNKLQLWGDPSDPEHDGLRGRCGIQGIAVPPGGEFEFEGAGEGEECPSLSAPNPKPFLTMPTDCSGPLTSSFEVFSWEGEFDSGSVQTHNKEGAPHPFSGCSSLPFKPSILARPTTRAAASPSGLDFSIDVEDEGLTSVKGRSQSRIRMVAFTLPEGMTANPSLAEGLEVCTERDLERETLGAAPGEGCPEGSKIGTIEVESPLLEEGLKGSLFVAKPHDNLAGNSLIALYIVIKSPKLGIIVKQTTRVEPDPRTGQLTGIAEDIPQLPFSHFRLHFREGGRSPLISPPLCGSYSAQAVLTPWSGTAPITSNSTFQIVSGPDEGPCPSGGTPPFEPGFQAGSNNNNAGAYSPFSMRLTRRDGDQDLTRFDATLPPGVVGKLAGIDKCPDAQIALAKTKTGLAELASPSCPLNSRIGSIQAGAGVGSQLTYVPGSAYLAGPFGGAPLSVVGIVPAVAGPFDVGTVVTRFALNVDPRTAEVTVDGAHSDPIPHILAGIPLSVRDIQVHVDRSGFTLNPTDCDPFATKAAIWGGGANPFSTADDFSVAREARYQAASCASLGFKPGLSLKLKGGTLRGSHPALHALLRPRSGDANIEATAVRLPHSAFLEQGHIRTICTRVQYAAKACPPGSVYGHVRAFTPLLSEPLEGPAYLRSSNHNLPDLVFSLHGIVDFEAVARLDSKQGGIRATFTGVPDAPISKVVVDMQGGRKGLIVNSRNLCRGENHANVQLDAHSGKQLTIKPVLEPSCAKKRKHQRAH